MAYNHSSPIIIPSDPSHLLNYQRKTCKDILEICQPLFRQFGITLFSHSRAYRDGTNTSLMTDTALTEYYLSQKYPLYGNNGKGININSGHYISAYTDSTVQTKIRLELRELFNVDHMVFIVDKQQDYDDMYFFATSPENTGLINSFINNISLFKYFILYYKEKSAKLLLKAGRVSYSKEYFVNDDIIINSPNGHFLLEQDYHGCLKSMALKKIPIVLQGRKTTITKRELECINYLAKSYTLKDIAKSLQLSPRTIESILNSLKAKFGCSERRELLAIANEHNLILATSHD